MPGFHAACARIAALRYSDFLNLQADPKNLKTVVRAALRTTPSSRLGPSHRKIHAYTDGSFKALVPDGSHTAAWAIAVLGEDEQGNFSFLGWNASSLETERDLVDANGEPSNNVAECIAIIWACVWVLTIDPDIIVNIHYDSKCSIDIAEGGPTAKGNVLISRVLSGLAHAVRARSALAVHHVHSHELRPWNELADQLATRAATQNSRCACPPLSHVLGLSSPQGVISTGPSEWLFLAFANQQLRKAYPNIQNDEFLIMKPKPSLYPSEISRPAVDPPGQPRAARPHRRSEIVLATFNVMTLDYDRHSRHEGLVVPKKMVAMQKQLFEKNADIIAIQESRCPRESTFSTEMYLCVCSPATPTGQGGCQVWLRRRARPQCQFCCQLGNITVVTSTPRILVVAIKAPCWAGTIIAYHAPFAQSPDDELFQFWNALDDEVRRATAAGHGIILMGDANATIGSVTSESIGSHCAENQSPPGERLHEILIQHSLWAPATFEGFASNEDSFTWRSPDGCIRHRIDHICVPASWRGRNIDSHVDYEFDTMLTVFDHSPVFLRIEWHNSNFFQLPKRRAAVCDPGSTRCEIAHSMFSQIIAACSQPGPSTSVHDQLAQVNAVIRNAAAACFPIQEKPKQKYISDETWQLILLRRGHRRLALRLPSNLARLRLELAFASWAGKASRAIRIISIAKQARLDAALAESHLRRTKCILSDSLKRDKLDQVRQTEKAIIQAAEANDSHAMCKYLKALRKTEPRPHPLVRLEDGSIAMSPSQSVERWRRFAHGVHKGHTADPQLIVEQADSSIGKHADITRILDAVPTIMEIAKVFSKSKPRRAFGEDSIPASLYQRHSLAMATILHPIMVKATMTIGEPIQWRGGMLCFFPKPGGKAAECSQNGEIVLSDLSGKALHKCRRQRLVPTIEAKARPTQMGGLKRRATDFGSLLLRATLDWHMQQGRSTACIFVDIVSAFYNLRRRFLCDEAMQLNDEGKAALHTTLTRLGASQHAAALADACLANTWFTMA